MDRLSNRPGEQKSQRYKRYAHYNLAASLVLLLALGVLWQQLNSWQFKRISDATEHLANHTQQTIGLIAESEILALERMAKRWRYSPTSKAQWHSDARAYIEDMPIFQAIEWVDSNYIVRWVEPVKGNSEALGLDLSFNSQRLAALQQAKAEQRVVISETVDLVQGGKGFLVFVPIAQRQPFQGFILGVIRVEKLFELLLSNQQLEQQFAIEVYDGEQKIWQSPHSPAANSFSVEQQLNHRDLNWRAVFTPSASYIESLKSTLPNIVVICGLAIIGLLHLTVATLLKLKQLNRLNQRNCQQLEHTNQALQQAQDKYRAINFLMPVGMLVVDQHGLIVEANKQASVTFGYSVEQLLGLNLEQLVPSEQREQHKVHRQQYAQKPTTRRMASQQSNLQGLTRQGEKVPLEIGLSPIQLNAQRHTLISVVDITERHEMLQKLQQQNLQMDLAIERLTSSNEQLERFAFACSHDLQEPLRMVSSFSELLTERIEPQLQEKDKQYLQFIHDGANRARNMVADILTFCRLEQHTASKQPVDLADICEQVYQNLQASIEEKAAIVSWSSDLPTINAVPTLIFQLLMNLVHNGIKFNAQPAPIVSISAQQCSDYWLIEVADNGIGIAPEYQQQIFQIFRRLHTQQQFPGTGIGLAICQKIAEQHGASLHIESQLEAGSRFILHWPEAEVLAPENLEPSYASH